MNSEPNNTANADFDSNSSEVHRDEVNSSSQAELNHQIFKLQTEANEIKSLLATLTQQVIFRPDEGNTMRACSSRTQERVDIAVNFSITFLVMNKRFRGNFE